MKKAKWTRVKSKGGGEAFFRRDDEHGVVRVRLRDGREGSIAIPRFIELMNTLDDRCRACHQGKLTHIDFESPSNPLLVCGKCGEGHVVIPKKRPAS